MKIKKYFRGGKISNGLEVTKVELENILKKVSYVSVSEADKNNLENFKDDEVVGVIMGDFTNILRDVMGNYEYEVTSNPDCWFVNKDFINKNYKELETSKFTFGEAIELLKLGFIVAREGWNGKGMFIFLVKETGSDIGNFPKELQAFAWGKEVDPYIVMYTAKGTFQPGWLASQADMLAEDWVIVIK